LAGPAPAGGAILFILVFGRVSQPAHRWLRKVKKLFVMGYYSLAVAGTDLRDARTSSPRIFSRVWGLAIQLLRF
jgi:hypothetical protein